MILNDTNIYNKYEDFMVRRVLATDPDTRWCPQPDCGYVFKMVQYYFIYLFIQFFIIRFAIIASGCASCPKIRCQRPSCPGVFCYHCKADWHPNQTCDAARTQRKPTGSSTDPISSGGVSSSFQPSSSPSIFGLSTSSNFQVLFSRIIHKIYILF